MLTKTSGSGRLAMFSPLAPFRGWGVTLALYLGLAVALYFYLSLFRDVLVDDAFITLRYVRTLRSSGTWGFFPGYISNTATSPMNVLLLTLVSFFTRSPIDAVVWLTLVELLVLVACLQGIGRRLSLDLFGWLAFVALVLNPWWISTLGLESTLFTTCLVAALWGVAARRFDALALACALFTLTRADGILLPAICLWAIPTWRSRSRFLILLAAAVAPWYVFSWVHLGSIVPDTSLMKIGHPWNGFGFGNGLRLYARIYPRQTLLAFVELPFAALAFTKPVRRLGAVAFIGVAYPVVHFAVYTLLRVGPYHWYYVPEIACVVLLAALAVSVIWREYGPHYRLACAGVAALAFALPLAGSLALFRSYGVPLGESFVHTNWATPAQYRAVGEWLKTYHGGDSGTTRVEIGTLAYYCDCLLLEGFGDRSWLTPVIAAKRAQGGVRAWLTRANYFFYAPPPRFPAPAYTLAVEPAFEDVDVGAPYWEVSSRWKPPLWLNVVSPR